MSYDLFFRSRVPDRSISRDEFAAYFGGRRHYEVQEAQAWYGHQDTGVYFSFTYGEQDELDVEEDAEPSLLPVSFELNYFRPHAFGLEAEPEVQAFVKAFDLQVSDPQVSGMGDGEYSPEGFLRGWNAGNEFAYDAILSREPPPPALTLPSARLETCWRWNYSHERRQRELGEKVFLPRIFFFEVDGVLRTTVIWADGIPVLMPTVDLVIVPRQELAPRKWFRSANDNVVFAWAELEPLLKQFPRVSSEPACFELFYELTPAEIERAIRAKEPAELPKWVPFDQVLDQEMVEKARSRANAG